MAGPWNGNGIIEYRRKIVASLILREPNIPQREIQHRVAQEVQNPVTGEPFSLGTIHNDIQEIKKEWMAKATQDYDTWIANELAGLDEVEGAAWKEKDLNVVLRCKERRSKLLGLDKPVKSEITGADGGPLTFREVLVELPKAEPMED